MSSSKPRSASKPRAHSSNDLSLAGQEVRRYDPDRFLTALFAPDALREDLFTLYAFNAEVARIPSVVSEPVLGHMRLQWWRDALGSEAPVGMPPLTLLFHDLVKKNALPVEMIEGILDARAFSLDTPAMPDRENLDNFVEATGGSLARLAWRVLGGTPGGVGEHAAHHAGVAYALVGLLRSAASEAAVGRVSIPELDLADKSASREHAATIATEAREHMAEARRLMARPGRGQGAVFLPAIIAEGALHRLHRAGYDLLDTALTLPLRRPLIMTWRAWRGTY